MRSKIVICSIIFFLLSHTMYFWQKLPMLWNFLLGLLLFSSFPVLVFTLIVQIIYLIKEKFRNTRRARKTTALFAALASAILFPSGIINFSKFEAPNLMVAQYEGVANCTTTLKLKTGNRFLKSSVCFGFEEKAGNYQMKGDTIKLEFDKPLSKEDRFAYCVVKSARAGKKILWYSTNRTEEHPIPMTIYFNEMTK